MYKGITKNSKDVKQGFVYCCFEGNKFSGYDFIDNALENGASLIIGERNLEIDNYLKVDDVNQAMIDYAQKIYDNPEKKLKIIGVTGTDGKTSIALIVHKILNKLSSSSYLGTNGFFIGEKEIEYNSFTTPFADKTFSYFKKSVDSNCEYFVMEVSSHALKQKRLNGIEYSSSIFTNLSKEHLDFHKTMEDYYSSKKELFKNTNGKKIVNIDDEYGKKINNELENILTVSSKIKDADFYFYEEKLSLLGTEFKLFIKEENKEYLINSPLLADFNVYNLVEAIACIKNLGYETQEIIDNLDDVFIPGRLEKVKNNLGINILIDFAHTADAILKVMEFINLYKGDGKVHVLTGSAGGRDKQKRSEMGKNASKYADYLYLTEDDPRDEKVKDIIKDIKSGIKNNKCEVLEEEKRKKAIKEMILNAQKGDTLVLFGKGEMKLMYYDGYEEDYFEKDVVKNILKGI